MLAYMNTNTALVIYAMVAMLGLAAATVVIPYIPQVQAAGNPGYSKCNNPGIGNNPSGHGNPTCL
jgi:hypothetical protein